ncbi:MAG: hypothetical protein SF052_04415 [Bacteroidia bacterium]|nr:hypothetical protein [Bacteroidia bacterium]
MPYRPDLRQSVKHQTRLTVKRTLTRTGAIILMALVGMFLIKSPEGFNPEIQTGVNPQKSSIQAQPDPVKNTLMVEFTVSGDKDMALQILNQNREEIMSRLFTPVPPTQKITLNVAGWQPGKYVARLYNHRQMVSYDFEIGPGVLTGR